MTTSQQLISILKSWKLPTWDEKEMQAGIAIALKEASIEHSREAKLKSGTIDFAVGKIGLECKIASRVMVVAEQLARYAEDPQFEELLLVTTVANHRKLDGTVLQGKPISVYWISPFG